MYKIFLVNFPFIDDPRQTKTRPAICLTKPIGKHKIIVIAFITTQIDEVLESDFLLDTKDKEFTQTGLKYTSVIRLHKLTSIPLENVEGEIGSLPFEWKDEIQSKLKSLFQLGK